MIALTKNHRNEVILVLQELAAFKKPVLPNNLLEQLLNVHMTRCIHCYWFHEPIRDQKKKKKNLIIRCLKNKKCENERTMNIYFGALRWG